MAAKPKHDRSNLDTDMIARRVSRHRKGLGGRPPFQPTPEDRQRVSILAAMGLSHDLLRQVVHNPATGRAIERATLCRAFAAELDAAGAQLDLMAATAIVQGIIAGDKVKLGMYCRNRWGWDRRHGAGLAIPDAATADGLPPVDRVEIIFVRAKPQPDDE